MADALHYGLDMTQALGGLLLDTAGQHLAGGHVDRQLAGNMVVVGEGDALAIERAAWCLVGVAGTDHQVVSVFHQLGRGAVTVGDDRIHLHPGTERQGSCADNGASGQISHGAGDGGVREEGAVDLVDGALIREAGQVEGHLDDVVKGHIYALQHVFDIAQALGRLLLDATGNQLAGGGIHRQLGADIVVVGEGHRMGREGIGRCPATVSGELDKGAGGLREGAFPVGEQGVHLNGGAERQTGHRQHGAGRQVAGEEFAINAVDRLQIPHVLEEEGHFHHVVHDVADALDYGLDIGQALSGLGLDIATYQLACPGIDGELGGNIVVVGEGHALGAGAQILRCIGGISG
ncbi:hypothetical protein D3C85_690280 [compost metagenome]